MRVFSIFLLLINAVSSYNMKISNSASSDIAARRIAKTLSTFIVSVGVTIGVQTPQTIALSATELPSLEKCFNAVRKELDSKQGESLTHIKNDIDNEKWDDLKLFTREYDAGFRGGVLKNAWKQLGNAKQQGIAVTNSFTFDLIALNKAARNQDKVDAYHRLDQITQDLKDFLALEQIAPTK